MKKDNNPHNLEVGQKLWLVTTVNRSRGEDKHNDYFVLVKTVGRKWAEIAGSNTDARINLKTLKADGRGYASWATCYLDKDEYQRQKATRQLWDKIKDAVNVQPSDDKVKQIAEILGVEL